MEKFPTVRPDFLKNITNKNLELDGYCPGLNMAFEYNGHQHYIYIPHFHREGPDQFEKQQERDTKKYKICAERNIKLIIIDGRIYDYTKPDKLETYVYAELDRFS